MHNKVQPFVLSCCNPRVATTNIFEADEEQLFKEKDTGMEYKRQKPVKLYKDFILMFSSDPSLYILDCCSGAGSCAVACTALKRKCVVLEKSEAKARLIQQRLNLNDE